MKSVLIIDDDVQSRRALGHIFEFLNHKIYEASSGQEGIDFYRRNPTDIVVIDIFMPEKDGLETVWDLRNEFPGVKIVVISGVDTGTMDYFRAARDFGAMQCIKKPVSVADIVEIVSQVDSTNSVEV